MIKIFIFFFDNNYATFSCIPNRKINKKSFILLFNMWIFFYFKLFKFLNDLAPLSQSLLIIIMTSGDLPQIYVFFQKKSFFDVFVILVVSKYWLWCGQTLYYTSKMLKYLNFLNADLLSVTKETQLSFLFFHNVKM